MENILSRCGCNFREDRITNGVFECFSSSPESVTYYAQLHGTRNANITKLIGALEDWVSSPSGVTIPVDFLPLKVSSMCAVSSSSPLEHCPDSTDETTTGYTVGGSDASGFGLDSPIFIGIIILAAMLAVVVITVLLACFARHRRSSKKITITNTR